MSLAKLSKLRADFHRSLLASCLTVDKKKIPSNADSSQPFSVNVALSIAAQIGKARIVKKAPGQTLGSDFESEVMKYLAAAFPLVSHLRPGKWKILVTESRSKVGGIAQFEQFEHLQLLADIAQKTPKLAAVLGNDYVISPDVVVVRLPEDDSELNRAGPLVDSTSALKAVLRRSANQQPLLHATISCKWSMRSDRSQNTRTEALNLLRNRKGRAPHIVVVTAEPTPARIASLALGTGDIDCVYHFALYELQKAVAQMKHSDSEELLNIMVEGKRLKDISDLPLDLAV